MPAVNLTSMMNSISSARANPFSNDSIYTDPSAEHLGYFNNFKHNMNSVASFSSLDTSIKNSINSMTPHIDILSSTISTNIQKRIGTMIGMTSMLNEAANISSTISTIDNAAASLGSCQLIQAAFSSITDVKKFINDTINSVKGIIDPIIKPLGELWNEIQSFSSEIQTTIEAQWNAIISEINDIINQVQTAIQDAITAIQQKISDELQVIEDAIKKVMSFSILKTLSELSKCAQIAFNSVSNSSKIDISQIQQLTNLSI